MSSTTDGPDGSNSLSWKEHLFIVHDASQCKDEHDPPENAIIVFLSPVEVEIRTQVYLCGGITAMASFGAAVTGTPPRVFILGREKMACKIVGQYSLFLSGHCSEPDDLIHAQLECLYSSFCFYHGSIDRIYDSCDQQSKRFSSTMTRIWSSLASYFRPPRDSLHSAFRPIPSLGLPRNENRHYAMASSLLERIQRRPGVLGGCVLHRQRAMYTQLSPDLTAYALALLQPTQSTSYTDEDNRRIQRRGLKIREMMLRGKNRLIRSREYRLRIYPNTFNGHEMVDLLIEKGEARTRDAAKQLGRRLMQAGIIRHVMNEQDFRDEQKLYRFRVDEDGQRSDFAQASGGGPSLRTPASHSAGVDGASEVSAAHEHGSAYGEPVSRPRSRLVDLRPLVLAGHGRDARTTAALHGLTLPAGVHLLPVYLTLAQLDGVLEMAEALRGGREADVVDVTELRASAFSTPGPEEPAEAAAEPEPEPPSAEEVALEFGTMLARLHLTPFQTWLVEQEGWETAAAIREKLSKTGPQALVRLAAQYSGNSAALTDALVAARDTIKGDAYAAAAAAAALLPSPSGESDRVQLELYLQGLGSTVLVTVLSPSHAQDQELLSALSAEVSEGLASIEESLTVHSESLGGTESQRTVDEYNFVSFDGDTHGITGWCNTDRSVRDQKLLPDTDEDRAFVKSVTEMHAAFTAPHASDVMEIQLRKNFHTAVYGCSAFGVESYIQFRQRGTRGGADDPSRPWDDDFALLPDVAKERFRRHGVNFV